MENTVELTSDQLVVTPIGMTKIAALKEAVRVPKAHVVGASIDAGILKESKGLRMPGTAIPGYWAGTFRKAGEETFFNIKQTSEPVVIQLKDARYTRIVIGVAQPRELVDQINNWIATRD
ncbi:hypothetical protein [Leuconostoc holzapfelii]|uniref:Bacterial Pleckstrin homology domain-containing protein n=1 Tax=Leuconostoc holzapfelii TaxID=434464 RepID=A0A846Z910_9LACO|nr:hypothetical protein [Leuconostoc holzapfelii]NKZ17846.1 hypothetical protein [Leuconostoc holzapfelii]